MILIKMVGRKNFVLSIYQQQDQYFLLHEDHTKVWRSSLIQDYKAACEAFELFLIAMEGN